jgi:hypothetical protein
MVRSFLNRGCAIQEIWKTGAERVNEDPGFPRVTQGGETGLCKVDGLCEKQVRKRMEQEAGRDRSCTGGEEGANVYRRGEAEE